uniref:Uncharacterized protein n=1 Tax=Aegilops tauschii subsp. strangulata TaxID=200361 RepID=A0A453R7K6_AEGTS
PCLKKQKKPTADHSHLQPTATLPEAPNPQTLTLTGAAVGHGRAPAGTIQQRRHSDGGRPAREGTMRKADASVHLPQPPRLPPL